MGTALCPIISNTISALISISLRDQLKTLSGQITSFTVAERQFTADETFHNLNAAATEVRSSNEVDGLTKGTITH